MKLAVLFEHSRKDVLEAFVENLNEKTHKGYTLELAKDELFVLALPTDYKFVADGILELDELWHITRRVSHLPFVPYVQFSHEAGFVSFFEVYIAEEKPKYDKLKNGFRSLVG